MLKISRQVVLIVVSLLLAGFAVPTNAGVTPEQVQDCIAKAKHYLYAVQANGNWETAQARNPSSPWF
jgi:hypothetical protein